MPCRAINRLTFKDLVAAFLDLFIAFLLLYASALAYCASKFLGLFDFFLPCSCNGLSGAVQNSSNCLQRLLVDCPLQKTSSLQSFLKSKFPLNLIWSKSHSLKRKSRKSLANGDLARFSETGSANKAKHSVRNRGGETCRIGEVRDELTNIGKDGIEFGGDRLDSLNYLSFQMRIPDAASDVSKEDVVSDNNVKNRIRELEQALEEEHAARAILYVELEKERSAAATAATEAMTMIQRLQDEKAMIEMEARQYQRMIEDKYVYDSEEMSLLKELLLRREREKYFLEKEVEAYRQVILRNKKTDPDIYGMEVTKEETSRLSSDSILTMQQTSDSVSGKQKKENLSNFSELENLKLNENDDGDVPGLPPSIERQLSQVSNSTVRIHQDFQEKPDRNTSDQAGKDNDVIPRESDRGLPPTGNSRRKIRRHGARRKSMSAFDTERLKIDGEINWIREKLRVVQEGRDKVNFPVRCKENDEIQLQMLEDLTGKFRESRQSIKPEKATRQASLPSLTSKVCLYSSRWSEC